MYRRGGNRLHLYKTKEDNISNNIEKVNIINDGGGEGGRGHPLKVNHRRDLIATPKFRLIVTTQPSPSQAPTQNLPEPPTALGSYLVASLLLY